jgi:hypothetical protein
MLDDRASSSRRRIVRVELHVRQARLVSANDNMRISDGSAVATMTDGAFGRRGQIAEWITVRVRDLGVRAMSAASPSVGRRSTAFAAQPVGGR